MTLTARDYDDMTPDERAARETYRRLVVATMPGLSADATAHQIAEATMATMGHCPPGIIRDAALAFLIGIVRETTGEPEPDKGGHGDNVVEHPTKRRADRDKKLAHADSLEAFGRLRFNNPFERTRT